MQRCWLGTLYSLISPWRVIVELVHSRGLDLTKPRVQYPAGAVYWPAFASYVALIWLELFVAPDPFGLSIILVVYSAVTFVGVYLFSQDTWFQRCDVFSVFFRLVSMLAPIKYVPSRSGESWQLRLRWPLVGALAAPAEVSASLILFVLFMLSSTTYDALHQTIIWAGWFWRPMLGFSQPLWGDDLGLAQQLLENLFLVYQRLGLLISPLAYFGLFILCLVLVRRITAIRVPLRVLARDFAYTLLPIAVVYNMTHYAPVFLAEIRGMPLHLTDPLDRGWNVLGLADVTAVPSELPMAIVWHIQVALIVAGHVASVYLAHVVASRICPTRRQVLIGQLPLLLLMVALTAAGLWVLALPLA